MVLYISVSTVAGYGLDVRIRTHRHGQACFRSCRIQAVWDTQVPMNSHFLWPRCTQIHLHLLHISVFMSWFLGTQVPTSTSNVSFPWWYIQPNITSVIRLGRLRWPEHGPLLWEMKNVKNISRKRWKQDLIGDVSIYERIILKLYWILNKLRCLCGLVVKSSWLQIQRSRFRMPALPDSLEK
jgi:hypothetical protein